MEEEGKVEEGKEEGEADLLWLQNQLQQQLGL